MKATPGRDRSKDGWFAHPALSILVAAIWLLLQQSLALPQLIAAGVLGLLLPRLIGGFLATSVRPRNIRCVLKLLGVIVWDVIDSNLTVARIVLTPGSVPRPAWVRVPMVIRHPVAQTLLASIITNTPGTVSCKVDEDSNQIVVHVLDCDDAQALVARIRQRYEQPLQEIFE